MMIKITEYCSMGCKHCMNAATTNGKDMRIDGGIGLGESDFCPSVASIYNSDEEILNNIINASCKQCYQHIDINFSALKQY